MEYHNVISIVAKGKHCILKSVCLCAVFIGPVYLHTLFQRFLRSTLGERFVIFGDPVVDGIPVHARREDSRFLVTWTGDVQNLRHFE